MMAKLRTWPKFPDICLASEEKHRKNLNKKLICPRIEPVSNLSVTLPTSQLILQPFRCFTYVTDHSPTLPMLHLHHSSFSNPFFASPKSQALHLVQLASRPCFRRMFKTARLKLVGTNVTSFEFQLPKQQTVLEHLSTVL